MSPGMMATSEVMILPRKATHENYLGQRNRLT